MKSAMSWSLSKLKRSYLRPEGDASLLGGFQMGGTLWWPLSLALAWLFPSCWILGCAHTAAGELPLHPGETVR